MIAFMVNCVAAISLTNFAQTVFITTMDILDVNTVTTLTSTEHVL